MKRFQLLHALLFVSLLFLLSLPEATVWSLKGCFRAYFLPLTPNLSQTSATPEEAFNLSFERQKELLVHHFLQLLEDSPEISQTPLSTLLTYSAIPGKIFSLPFAEHNKECIIWAKVDSSPLDDSTSLIGAAVTKQEVMIGIVAAYYQGVIAIKLLDHSHLTIPSYVVRGNMPFWIIYQRVQKDIRLAQLLLKSHSSLQGKSQALPLLERSLTFFQQELLGPSPSPTPWSLSNHTSNHALGAVIASGLVTPPLWAELSSKYTGKLSSTLQKAHRGKKLIGESFVSFQSELKKDILKEIAVGDLVVTSGYEGIYPPGLKIGLVSDLLEGSNSSTASFEIEPFITEFFPGDTIQIVISDEQSISASEKMQLMVR